MKTVKSVLLLMLVLLFAAQTVTAASTTSKIKITFVSANLTENNHVGNEWWTGGFVNGKEVAEGASVTLNVKSTDTIKLRAEAQEQDKYPDDGQANASVKVSSVTKAGSNKTMTVNVVENRGRYSGNTAKWSFTFRIQKIS